MVAGRSKRPPELRLVQKDVILAKVALAPVTQGEAKRALCISLPIPIIVNNFNKFYEKSKIEEEIKAKKTKASWEDAKRGELLLISCC